MKFKRRFYRKFKYNRKRSFMFIFFFLLCLSFGLGYSLISTDINIFGTTVLKDNRWDVHFDNIVEDENSVSPTVKPEITDNTTVSFSAKLENPGEKYEFLIDVVNSGTIDATIGSISMSPILTEEQQNYFSYKVTYNTGLELSEEQALDAGTTETLKVVFKYLDQEDDSLYPTSDQIFNVSLTIEYVQGKGTEVIHPYLYDVLERSTTSGLTKKYTSSHRDSFTEEPSKDIYYWSANTTTLVNEVLNKYNVLFAGYCWQIIRTTDTGGVKMFYNGKAIDNQCLDTRENQLGMVQTGRTTTNLSSNYVFGDKLVIDEVTSKYKIGGNIVVGNYNTEGTLDKFTCKSADSDATCATAYYYGRKAGQDNPSVYVYPFTLQSTHYSQIGISPFNSPGSSLRFVGYMVPERVSNTASLNSIQNIGRVVTKKVMDSTTNYYFSDSITYNNGTYQLVNSDSSPVSIYNWETDYENAYHKYSCLSGTSSSCQTIYYALKTDSSSMYYKTVTEGSLTPSLNIKLSTDIIENGTNYELDPNGLVTVSRESWITDYSNYTHYYFCENLTDSTCDKTKMYYIITPKLSDQQKVVSAIPSKYSNSVVYENGKYILDEATSVNVADFYSSSNRALINNAHYTCFNESGECTRVNFVIYYESNSESLFYVPLSNGDLASDELVNMLSDENVNKHDSAIKRMIETWAANYLEDYTDYLEDIIFYNDRTISSLGPWSPTGNITSSLGFNKRSFTSPVDTDKFSVSNEKAKLKYPIGLATYSELYNINTNLRKTGQNYWTMTPIGMITELVFVYRINPSGSFVSSSSHVSYANTGVRPVISLKKGTLFTTGTGSMDDPYVVDTSN